MLITSRAAVVTPPAAPPEPGFTQSWTRGRTYWDALFESRGLNGQPDLRFLEIGCFEGRATLWLLENVLTDPTSRIDVIDTFAGSPEFERMGVDGASVVRFVTNVAPHAAKVRVRQGTSVEHLRTLPLEETYDFVYVDGSHAAPDVLTDAVLAWPLLKRGGVMVFDDYKWQLEGHEHTRPALAIDAFVSVLGWQMGLLHQDAQLAVEKL